MGQTWGPSGADRTQVGPMVAPWTLLSEMYSALPSAMFSCLCWHGTVFILITDSILANVMLPHNITIHANMAVSYFSNIDGSVQVKHISIASTLEICTVLCYQWLNVKEMQLHCISNFVSHALSHGFVLIIQIQISLKFVTKDSVNNMPVLL